MSLKKDSSPVQLKAQAEFGRCVSLLIEPLNSLAARSFCSSLALLSLVAAVALTGTNAVGAEELHATSRSSLPFQAIVEDLKARLSIGVPVVVTLVPRNTLLLSVAPPEVEGEAFRLDIDAEFAEALTAPELEAALAHELGHVWVFTHHPYLQTEQLANDIAMRVVNRATLAQVYDKLWRREGFTAPDITRFLSPEPSAEKTRAAHPGN